MAASTRRLLIVFGALLVVTLVWKGVERRRTTVRVRTFAHFDTGQVTRIELGGKNENVALERRGDRWMLVEPLTYPADPSAVASLLEKAADLNVVNLVSSNPANHDLYEVGPDTGSLVRLLGGPKGNHKLLEIYVGKLTSDFGHTYVREFGSDEVYTARGLLQGYFGKTVSAWRDHTIWELAADSIRKVELTSPEHTWTLLHRDLLGAGPGTVWNLRAEGETVAADSSKVVRLLRTIATLRAGDFPAPGEGGEIDWSVPGMRLVVTLEDGQVHAATAVAKEGDASRRWIRKDGDETVFIVYQSSLDSIRRPKEDLLPESPPPDGS
jgi:hypothetical protein